jgi:hypothetical protein
MSELKLNLGAGYRHYKGFVNVDVLLTPADIRAKKKVTEKKVDKDAMFIQRGSKFLHADMCQVGEIYGGAVDLIESIDAVEHIPFRTVPIMLRSWHKALKVGGKVKIMTINFNQLAMMWINNIVYMNMGEDEYMNLQEMIYGNQYHPGEFHQSLWNPNYAYAVFKDAGFKDIIVTIYPKGNTTKADMETVYWIGWGYRSEMMVVEATK